MKKDGYRALEYVVLDIHRHNNNSVLVRYVMS